MTQDAVLFDEWPTRDGRRIGAATLNAPRSLNALSLAMIEQLQARLTRWAGDPAIAAVWLEGAGDKAFCAGGDVVALYRAMRGTEGSEDEGFAARYFAAEYRLDYCIHRYPKPLIVWGDGIIMGGGLGLMAGGGERVVTETSRIAMPEITIGLYPDIGASWFLGRMPTGVGAYLGLTGAQLNARDALLAGLADRFIPRERRATVIAALQQEDIACPGGVAALLAAFEARGQVPESPLLAHFDTIQNLAGVPHVGGAVRRILDDSHADPWLAANRRRLAEGCPTTAHLLWSMLARHRHSSLADTFRDELNLSVQCTRHADLAEGVRALLIDKDKAPLWSYPDVASVPPSAIEDFLAPLWSPGEHPLRDL
ncbi:enoyl-CoA hydratase/isomerase family protein [Modicisalibacter radicis]|uniref:enoyl-CoA hydratase/isomerase family protein n=1 Tax=Halomonas sp. EAR18 TaxID=2518972 RepID=UPI00109C763F|nr:enoyl-CoA hydratase/isomerase family protein [Halomonas sp. EAR18]